MLIVNVLYPVYSSNQSFPNFEVIDRDEQVRKEVSLLSMLLKQFLPIFPSVERNHDFACHRLDTITLQLAIRFLNQT